MGRLLNNQVQSTLTIMVMAFAGFGVAAASALLVTTPACELLSDDEASAAIGEAMTRQGGTADDVWLSDCFWQGAGDAQLRFSLAKSDLFAPSGRTALDAIEAELTSLRNAKLSYDDIHDLGARAAMTETPEFRVLYMVAGEDYLTIVMTGGSRAAAIAVAKAAAGRM